MFSGGSVAAMGAGSVGAGSGRKPAFIKIIEQPASKALRFRYQCEGRSAGSIPGINSTSEQKTFPSIRIEGYHGRAVVVVSCVTKDPPHRPHPHNLVGKEACRKGVCTLEISPESMTVTFTHLGIQCVKRRDIKEALRVREEIRVDPFRTGFSHSAQPASIDLNAVRLCFQVFLEGAEKGKFSVLLAPVVSDPIYDKKAPTDLVICKLSECCSTVSGGKEMILLCEKVAKKDIQVRFFEERDDQLVWEGLAALQPSHVHKQVAISFRTPRYRDLEVDQPVQVFIQLRRPSDGVTSDALPFEFLPLDSDPKSKRKRKYAHDPSTHVLMHLQAEAEKHSVMQHQPLGSLSLNTIKSESVERGLLISSLYQVTPGARIPPGGFAPVYRSDQGTPSPQPFSILQRHRHQPFPDRTPSPMMEYSCIPEATLDKMSLANLHHQHQEHQLNLPSQRQATPNQHSTRQQQMMLNRVNTEQAAPTFPPPITTNIGGAAQEGVSCMLNLDSRQYNSELSSLKQLNSTDLASLSEFDDKLAQNLSTNLSLSDINVSQSRAKTRQMTVTEAVGVSRGNRIISTNSFDKLTTNTIQELCALNDIYNPPWNDTG